MRRTGPQARTARLRRAPYGAEPSERSERPAIEGKETTQPIGGVCTVILPRIAAGVSSSETSPVALAW